MVGVSFLLDKKLANIFSDNITPVNTQGKYISNDVFLRCKIEVLKINI